MALKYIPAFNIMHLQVRKYEVYINILNILFKRHFV